MLGCSSKKHHTTMKNQAENTLLKSIWNLSCPHCRKGEMFTHTAFNLKYFNKMNDHCLECKQPFEPEPGFYTGAMYVSYVFQIAVIAITFVAMQLMNNTLGILWYMAIIFSVTLILLPLIFRLSRSIWIYMFIKFEGFKIKEIQ
ncbi:MAG: hypothetical protein ACI9J3_003336 [Parvicellaceae bacterium]|jgi:uncharacterized protein (DUF983 family)